MSYMCAYILNTYIYMYIALRNLRIIEDNRIIEDFRQENQLELSSMKIAQKLS